MPTTNGDIDPQQESDAAANLLLSRFFDGVAARIESNPGIFSESGLRLATVKDWKSANVRQPHLVDARIKLDSRRFRVNGTIQPQVVEYLVSVDREAIGSHHRALLIRAEANPTTEQFSLGSLGIAVQHLRTRLNGGQRVLSGIFCPAGWTSGVEKAINGTPVSARFRNADVSIVLVNARWNVLHNSSDVFASDLAHYFMEGHEDEIAVCCDLTLKLVDGLLKEQVVSIAYVAEQTDCSEYVVLKAIDSLTRRRLIQTVEIDGAISAIHGTR